MQIKAGQQHYPLPAYVAQVTSCIFIASPTADRIPLHRIGLDMLHHLDVDHPHAHGVPAYYVLRDTLSGAPTLTLWPTPMRDAVLLVRFLRPLEDL